MRVRTISNERMQRDYPGQSELDIISSLPLQLVVHVVDFLDQADVIRSQRVSKRWRSIFSSDALLKSLLPRTLAALGMESTNVAGANPMTYIRWLVGLQFGRPVKKVFLPPLWRHSRHGADVVFHSRRLAFGIPGHTEVTVLHLETGKRSTWPLDEGHSLRFIILSDRYLIIGSRDKSTLIAWNLHTSQKVVKRHTPWSDVEIVIVKDKVVIVPRFSSSDNRSFCVCVWDLHGNRLYEFGSFSDLYLWHVDADENVLITIEFNWNAHPPEVRQTKWTLIGGQKLRQKHFRVSLEGRPVNILDFGPSRNDYYRSYSHKTITLMESLSENQTILHIMYDYAVDRLSFRWIDCAYPITELVLLSCGSPTPHIIYRWAHQLRGVAIHNADTGTISVRLYQLDVHEVGVRNLLGADLPPPSRPIGFFDLLDCASQCFGDREVIGMPSEDGIQLWFFNPDFLPDITDAEPFLALEESG